MGKSAFSFATTLRYSKLFESTLNAVLDCSVLAKRSEFTTQLLECIAPILTLNRSRFQSLVLRCLLDIHRDYQFEDDPDREFPFKEQMERFASSLHTLQLHAIEVTKSESDQKPIMSASSVASQSQVSCTFADTPEPKSFDALPSGVIAHVMSWIDAVQVACMERTCHLFLQCARSPNAIAVLSKDFFEFVCARGDDDHQCNQFMQRYGNLRQVRVEHDALLFLQSTKRDDLGRNEALAHSLTAWVDMDNASLKTYASLLSEFDENVCFKSYLYKLNAAELKGLRYRPKLKRLRLSVCEVLSAMNSNALMRRNMADIRRAVEHIPTIEVDLNAGYDPYEGRCKLAYLWCVAFCHANVETLHIKTWYSRASDESTNISAEYIRTFPTLHRLKHLKVLATNDIDSELKPFFETLRMKMADNTLETLELAAVVWEGQDGAKALQGGKNVGVFSLPCWVRKQSHSLQSLVLTQTVVPDDKNDVATSVMHLFAPLIAFHEIITAFHDNIHDWLTHTLKTITLRLHMSSLSCVGRESPMLGNLRHVLATCIRFCQERNMSYAVSVRVHNDTETVELFDALLANARTTENNAHIEYVFDNDNFNAEYFKV